MLDWKSKDIIMGNFEVLMFKNVWFNFSVFSFLAREIAEYFFEQSPEPSAHHNLSKGIVTLHISIILGIFIWAFVTGRFMEINMDFGKYASALAILPFLIIKFVFEIMEIKSRHNQHRI